MNCTGRRLQRLIERYASDALTAEEIRELESQLSADAESLENFVLYMELHARMAWQLRAQDEAGAPADGCSAPQPPAAKSAPSASPAGTTFPGRSVIARLNHATPYSLITASVVVVVVLTLALQFSLFSREPAAPIAQTHSKARPNETARLVWSDGAKWGAVGPVRLPGGLLQSGERVELVSGWCEIAFGSGCRVLLQGPASFQVESPARGRLELGRLLAIAPPAARGFVINTPAVQIIDLGTEFGVSVGENSEAEVQVLQGAVELRPMQSSASPRRLIAGQAVRVAPSGGAAQTLFQPMAFRHENFLRDPRASGPIVVQSAPASTADLPVTDGLALWFSADHQVMLDRDGRVFAWGDRLAGDNQQAENAWQRNPALRPELVTSAAFGNRPAVRFEDPRSSLVTAKLASGEEQSVVAVFAYDEKAAHGCRQLFNGNGPPHLVLEVGDNHSVTGGMFIGDKGLQRDAELTASLPQSRQASIAVYVYSPRRDRAEIYVGGQLQKEAAAPLAVLPASEKWIGNHPIEPSSQSVEIAELLVYNLALTSAQVELVSRHLAEKYHPIEN